MAAENIEDTPTPTKILKQARPEDDISMFLKTIENNQEIYTTIKIEIFEKEKK